MPEAATLPTRRDEAWRYADMDFIAQSDPAVINHWRVLDVPAGETRFEYTAHDAGADSPGMVDRLRVHVGKGGRFEAFKVITGGKYARVELEVTLDEGAHFEFGGVTIGGGEKVQEFVTTTVHAQPGATSNQTVRAVQWGTATGNFLGEVKVARHAQKTDAAQSFKGLLLEAGASANAVPQLEIFADDVKCAHGATVGELDEAARYYMAARGLSPELAQKLLVQAFIGDAFVALDDEATRERLLEKALEALEGRV
ncbi:SufD family Fe-S cluster assembly protein [uncultured Erythrobacter sp.]|uniref:SufD family Fe-S cluster assembly protein n=1 Tax=uncultured Erythrobacter sp. TaxID=263913 RepID=UPI0026075E02|nr:SufD family Fe-S cluster assembly protein [uncultured Erythrobacter sp.]